jgi:hypothetical protein
MKSVQESGASDSQPYPHFILRPFEREFLLKLKEEVLSLGASFKETDLFRINQTIDFANLTSDHFPQLSELKATLYSDVFRSHIENVTGCGKLNTRVDCAGNMYKEKAQNFHCWCVFFKRNKDIRVGVIWDAMMTVFPLAASATFYTCRTKGGQEVPKEN